MFRSKLILGVGTAVALGCGFGVLANPSQANADTVTSTGIEHTVVQGDTLWGLSQKYGVSLQNLFNTNNKSETNSFLQIGDQILIPGAKTAQATTATIQHTNTNISATGNTRRASTASTTASAPTSAASTASTVTQASTTAQATQASTSARKTASTASSSSVATPVAQSSSTTATAPAQTTPSASASTNTNGSTASSSAPTATTGGSTYSQFIAAGGTPSLWSNVVIPESGGQPSASNGQYHGLGQTAESWGQGSVANQTKGMVNYATSRYGSVSNAISFRAQHGWW